MRRALLSCALLALLACTDPVGPIDTEPIDYRTFSGEWTFTAYGEPDVERVCPGGLQITVTGSEFAGVGKTGGACGEQVQTFTGTIDGSDITASMGTGGCVPAEVLLYGELTNNAVELEGRWDLVCSGGSVDYGIKFSGSGF
jgi:hypothetical protein